MINDSIQRLTDKKYMEENYSLQNRQKIMAHNIQQILGIPEKKKYTKRKKWVKRYETSHRTNEKYMNR